MSFDFVLSDSLGPLEEEVDRIRNVVAEFRLFVGGELLYRDVEFPVIELALALSDWAERVSHTGEPFAFGGRSSTLRSLFEVRRGMQGWYLTSVQQDLPSSCVFQLEQVLEAARDFIVELERQVLAEHGFSPLGMRRQVAPIRFGH